MKRGDQISDVMPPLERSKVISDVMYRMELLNLDARNPMLYEPVFAECGVNFEGFKETPIESWLQVQSKLSTYTSKDSSWDLVFIAAIALGLSFSKL